MKQPLAIVGASTRSAAASAMRAGFQPIAADLFADADLRRIATATRIAPYPDGFADWLRTIEPPAWMYTGAMENHAELVDEMAWIAPLWGNSGDVLARVRSPWELALTLRGAGLLFPEMRSTTNGLPRDGSWLAKTYEGASGSGVRAWGEERVSGGEESQSPIACYQQRIDGTPCAAVFVAAEGVATLLGVTRQLIGEPWLNSHGFQYSGSIGLWPIADTAHATLVRLGNVLAEQFELLGLFGVDFILNGDEVWTIEVNPRYTASVEVVERFTGTIAIALHANACASVDSSDKRAGASPPLSIKLNPSPTSPLCHGKATLFARRDLTISDEFAKFSLQEALREPWPTLADISPAGTPVEAGRPILTVFAEAANVTDAEQCLRDRVVELEHRLYTA